MSSSQRVHSCEDLVKAAATGSQPITFLVAKLQELGSKASIKCVDPKLVDDGASAGYQMRDHETGAIKRGDIVLPNNRKYSSDEFERLVTHELIHQYDDTRAYLDVDNCHHQACSEIRAARLSGDCSWWLEWQRGNWQFDFQSQGKRCVERRAKKSLDLNPKCSAKGYGYVNNVWEACYRDFEPFRRPPYG